MGKELRIGVVVVSLVAGGLGGFVVGYKTGIQGRFNLDLQSFARLTSETSSEEPNPLALAVEVVESHGAPELRCRLTNISHEAVEIAEHALPCKFNQTFLATGISLTGRSELSFTWPMSMIIPSPEPQVQLLPGQTLMIDGQLRSMFQNDTLPKMSDVLLLWSYYRDKHVNTGMVLLPGSARRAY